MINAIPKSSLVRAAGISASFALVSVVLLDSSCTQPAPAPDTSTATFAAGTDDSLGTFRYDGGSFELQADARGALNEVRGDSGYFQINSDGTLKRVAGSDGGTFTTTRNSDDTLTIDVDDPELGQVSVTASLEGRPELLAARTRIATTTSTATATASAKPLAPQSRELDDFEALDLTTFCQVTNACALAELYTNLFVEDVIPLLEEAAVKKQPLLGFLPTDELHKLVQDQTNKALDTNLEFCREWNKVVQELDDNPCTSSDDPQPEEPQDCSANGTCNLNCPDTEPDPDCSNDEICTAKGFCCIGDQICDIRRCNELDADCTNFLLCDRLHGCCDDDNRCDAAVDGLECAEPDADCAYCGVADEVCIERCTPTDPDCEGSNDCPLDALCDATCAGIDPDCVLCGADDAATCITDCDPPDPDCTVVANITAEGSVSSSSTYHDDSGFDATRAADGSTSSNWFSDGHGGGGPDADSEVFTWTYNSVSNTSIARIETDPETFEGGGSFGFATVQVLVLDVAGETVYDSGFQPMSGHAVDLNVLPPDGTEGRTVILTLVDHQDSTCGGFSEFRVFGLRDISEVN